MNKPAATASPFRNAQQRENDRAAKREAVLLAAVRWTMSLPPWASPSR
jgi:hypothetical protein